MAKEISNYILLERNTRKQWRVPEVGEKYSLTGTCGDGNVIYLSEVSIVEPKKAVSEDGETIELVKMQKDYKTFYDATKKDIPIIDTWNIIGKKGKGYTITGFCKGIPTEVKVTKQVGNFIVSNIGQVYFIMWNLYSKEFEDRMFDWSIAAEDIKFNDSTFEWFGESMCKPKIPGAYVD